MPTVRATVLAPGPAGAAERLWSDRARWPAFRHGFGHLATDDDAWPEPGATVVWDERPGIAQRHRVLERVERRDPGALQHVAFEDERVRGTLTTAFAPDPGGGGTRVTSTLRWTPKDRRLPARAVDLVLTRRRLADGLDRTLARFAIELRDEVDPPL